MFCKNCGTQLADNAAFCANCGTAVANETSVQPQYAAQPPVYTQAPVAPKQPNPMFSKFLAAIVDFWKSPTATVANAAKSNTHEWVLLAALGVLTYALGAAVVGLEMISQLINSIMGEYSSYVSIGSFYPFFAIFGVSLLIGAAAYGVTAAGVWVLVTQVLKKNATFIQVLNMVTVATLPLAAIHIFNMLAGLIYSPITIVFMIVALVASAALLYVGIQKFEKLEKSPFYGYTIVMAIVIFTVFLLGLIYTSVIADGITGIMGL